MIDVQRTPKAIAIIAAPTKLLRFYRNHNFTLERIAWFGIEDSDLDEVLCKQFKEEFKDVYSDRGGYEGFGTWWEKKPTRKDMVKASSR